MLGSEDIGSITGKGERSVEIFDLSVKGCFRKLFLKFINASLEIFAYTNSPKHTPSFYKSILAHLFS